jgi:hypothetical protein
MADPWVGSIALKPVPGGGLTLFDDAKDGERNESRVKSMARSTIRARNKAKDKANKQIVHSALTEALRSAYPGVAGLNVRTTSSSAPAAADPELKLFNAAVTDALRALDLRDKDAESSRRLVETRLYRHLVNMHAEHVSRKEEAERLAVAAGKALLKHYDHDKALERKKIIEAGRRKMKAADAADEYNAERLRVRDRAPPPSPLARDRREVSRLEGLMKRQAERLEKEAALRKALRSVRRV